MADDTTPDQLAATLTEAARYAALHRALGRGPQIVHLGRGDAPGATLTVDMLDQLIEAATTAAEPVHEVDCPACGATIRARLADVESGDSGLDPAIEKARARGRARGQQVAPHDNPDILAAHLDNALARERWAAQDHAYAAAQVGALRERIATLAPSAGSDTTTETED